MSNLDICHQLEVIAHLFLHMILYLPVLPLTPSFGPEPGTLLLVCTISPSVRYHLKCIDVCMQSELHNIILATGHSLPLFVLFGLEIVLLLSSGNTSTDSVLFFPSVSMQEVNCC